MTFAELKTAIDALTPEQLAMDVIWMGEERGGEVHSLWIAEEDLFSPDGDAAEPRYIVEAALADEIASGDLDLASVLAIAKGTPRLMVDM